MSAVKAAAAPTAASPSTSPVVKVAKVPEEPFKFRPAEPHEISVSDKFSPDKGWQQHSARTRYLPFRWWNKQLSMALARYSAGGIDENKIKYLFDFLEEYYGQMVELYFDTEAAVYDEWLQFKVQRPLEDAMATDTTQFRKLFYEAVKYRDYQSTVPGRQEFVRRMSLVIDLVSKWIENKEDGYVSNFTGSAGLSEEEERIEWHVMLNKLGAEGKKRYLPGLMYCLRSLEPKEAIIAKIDEFNFADKNMLNHFWFKDFEAHQLNVLSGLASDKEVPFKPPPECGVCTLM
mmetsp:Transcript_13806/g.30086  ORF Transcript_13806/g.30086 Transcript_13806/m.30086 type:complete len:289 (+) Transcript_13806:275-1141(+)|eukprot:CAMPEP_0206584816 /NCGR_PEP_ID=MMETSP0325_2-20121206/35999_1 /ASSEMBLY_ACC=CAM_ASM_000347 /TAXON_ID=2866 /ORGANISM="Crypthecodinium cohnii, Strain Seligo" /LENGTH=288 /DNA_ID=CAMNT_0054092149 /DNA_START=221 /DNA_END=1087 /DNA_ORIENTATION=-